MRKLKTAFFSSLIINVGLLLVVALLFVRLGGIGFVNSYFNKSVPLYSENPSYIERVSLFEQFDEEENHIAFVGDSLTFRNEWKEFFPNHNVVNRGIGSDNTSGVLARIDEVLTSNPSKIFLMVGINDIIYTDDYESAINNYEAILKKIKDSNPKTQVFVQSILPVNNAKHGELVNNEDVKLVNEKIKKIAIEADYEYVDVYSNLSENDQLKDAFTEDGIHLNGHGYKEWASIIESKME